VNHHRSLFAGVLALALLAPALWADDAEEAGKLAQQAQELSKNQKFEQAHEALKKAVGLAPRNDLYLAMLSDCELKLGKNADGLEHALAAIKINDKVGAYHILAAAHARGEQDIDRAREICETILKRGQEFGPGASNDARTILALLVPKTYTLHWELDPRRVRYAGGALLVAMPKGDLPYQSVTYEVKGAQSHRLIKGDVNDVLQVVPQGARPFTLITKVTVQPYSYKKELAKAAPKPLPPDALQQLGSIFSVDVNSPTLKRVAAGLKGKNNVETVRNIQAWMKKNVEYQRKQTPLTELDFKTVDDIVKRGHAECRGYAMLFTALCRAAGVPARPIWGLIRVPREQEKTSGQIASHNWVEFYVPGCGWLPIDPQAAETLGCLPTSHLRFFMDAKKAKASPEGQPLVNLLFMNGDKLRFEETLNTTGSSSPDSP
jgi:tetratricopeptide (TPR) repeat protein